MKQPKVVNIGDHRKFENESHRHDASLATATAFVSSVFFTIFVAFLSLNDYYSLSIPKWVNNENAQCVRVQRLGDAALASVAVGTPPRTVKLLIRLDKIVNSEIAHVSTVIFADELMRSETLRCDDSRRCSDLVILSESTTGSQIRKYVEFKYGNAASSEWSIERQIGSDGSMALVRGWMYSLTKTHFCWTNSTISPQYDKNDVVHRMTASIDNETGVLSTSSEQIEPTQYSPFLDAPSNTCNSSIEVFPVKATAEQSWLALSSGFLYEASTTKLETRRTIVERGLGCAKVQSEREIYEMDCALDPYAECRQLPSIPFRRLSRHRIDIDSSIVNATVSFSAIFEVALSRISGSITLSQTVFFAAVRLCVLLIVAFVVYSRAERKTASAFHTIDSALSVASGKEKRSYNTKLSLITDAAVGLLAIASRAAVVMFQSSLLISDGHLDGVVFECIGVFVSALHFLLRNIVLEIDLKKESPIQKLGGSMALADAANAALLSVVSAPTLQVSTRDFDSVARLFCGVLIAIFVLHRCWFSVTSCVLLASTTATDNRFDPSYSIVLYSAALLWMIQTISTVFAFGRFFVVPQAYSLHRNFTGSTSFTESVVLLTFVSLGTPLVNSIVLKLCRVRL